MCLKALTEVNKVDLASKLTNRSCYQQSSKTVQNSTAAADRRRMECLLSISALDNLPTKLTKMGYNLSRSELYLHLLPHRRNTSERKRYVNTVPLKLLRPENSLRKENIDGMFAKSFIDDMFEICKLFGPNAVLFMSNDEKAIIPLGLPAANLQAPLLMHMEYQVKLLNHDFVIGPQHQFMEYAKLLTLVMYRTVETPLLV